MHLNVKVDATLDKIWFTGELILDNYLHI